MPRHPHPLLQPHGLGPWLSRSGLLLGLWLAVSQAQVRTTLTADGTLGTTVTATGNLHTITGGTRPGNGPNLFHSFDRFSVGTNDTARFTGPAAIQNILSRVTGGQRSEIDGRVQSTIPGANLYLLNPSGMVFGPNATLDVTGSFHVSTADYLRFADGATFAAHVGQQSTLTVAAPAAFGFLGPTPGPMTMRGSALEVPAGHTLSVVAGDITLVGNAPAPPVPTLAASGGRIQLVSVAAPGEVGVDRVASAPDLRLEGFTRLGQIDLSQGAVVTVGSGGSRHAGAIEVRGAQLTLRGGSQMDASTQGTGQGGTVQVQVTEALTLTGAGSRLSSSTSGAGAAGQIVVHAPRVHLQAGAAIQSLATGTSQGNAGTIRLEVGTLTLTGESVATAPSISTDALGAGQGGSITVRATEAVTLTGPSSRIDSDTSGAGNAGQIVVHAPVVDLRGNFAGIRASAFRNSQGIRPRGNAGAILVEVGTLTLTDGAAISVSTAGAGQGGSITVRATGAVTLTGTNSRLDSQTVDRGTAGDIRVEAGTLMLSGGARIDSRTAPASPGLSGAGQGGRITVQATEAVALTGAGSRLTSSTSGDGAAGQIAVHAPRVHLQERATIQSQANANSQGIPPRGNAGDILVEVGTLTLTGGAAISVSTAGAGQGGSITVRATEALTLTGAGSRLTSSTSGAGAAGQIVVHAPRVHLQAGAAIQSLATGTSQGNAGTIRLEVGTLTLTGESVATAPSISTDALGAGQGGSITVRATEAVTLTGPSSRIDSDTSGAGNAGQIVVHAPVVDLRGNFAGIRSSAFRNSQGIRPRGNAGAILVEVGTLTLTDGAAISVITAGAGQGGSITVRATGAVTLTGTNSRLDSQTVDRGTAGDIRVEAGTLMLSGGARIDSRTAPASPGLSGAGQGGRITVQATEAVALTGAGSRLTSSTSGDGAAGQIAVHAPRVHLQERAAIQSQANANSQGIPPRGNAGDILVEVGTLTLTDGAAISVSTAGAGQGGSITVRATEALTLTGPSSRLDSVTVDRGTAGDIRVEAGTLMLSGGARIDSSSTGGATGHAGAIQVDTATFRSNGSAVTTEAHAGAGGTITLAATTEMALSDTTISATVTGGTDPARPPANVSLTTPTLTITGGRLAAETQGVGNAGNITVQVGTAAVQGAAQITSSSTATATGAAGTVTIHGLHEGTAADAITLTQSALLTRADGEGTGGNILVHARRAIFDGATLTATANTGAGGTITVDVPTGLEVRGTKMTATVAGGSNPGGDITLRTPALTMTASRLAAETQGAGPAGNITLAVGTVVGEEVTLTSSSPGATPGAAGSVTIHGLDSARSAPTTVRLTHSALQTNARGTGAGGAITVAASEALTLDQTILSATVHDGTDLAGGPRGDLTLTTPTLTVTGGLLTAETTGTRRAGDITLNVGTLTAMEATLTSSSIEAATGNAGTVRLQGPGGLGTTATRVLFTGSTVATKAAVADGGDIQVLAQETLRLRDSQITTAVGSGRGRGGNILIDPDFVILERSRIVADAFGGPGGNIRIVATGFVADAASQVSASSAQNVNGLIDIQAVTNPTGLVTPLPQSFAPAAELLHDRCAGRVRGGIVSRFVLGGRDGVPLEPGSWLPSALGAPGPQAAGDSALTPHQGHTEHVGGRRRDQTAQTQVKGAYAQARWPGELDVECTRWKGQPRTTIPSTR